MAEIFELSRDFGRKEMDAEKARIEKALAAQEAKADMHRRAKAPLSGKSHGVQQREMFGGDLFTNPMKQRPKPTTAQVAAMFGVPIDRVRAHYASNATDLRRFARKAGSGKYRGKTAKEWALFAEHAERQSRTNPLKRTKARKRSRTKPKRSKPARVRSRKTTKRRSIAPVGFFHAIKQRGHIDIYHVLRGKPEFVTCLKPWELASWAKRKGIAIK